MIKLKVKKIKINRFLLWQFGVVAFIVLFVAILLLNASVLLKTKKETVNRSVDGDYAPVAIKEKLLEDIFSEIEERRSVFEKNFLNKPDIKDPSM